MMVPECTISGYGMARIGCETFGALGRPIAFRLNGRAATEARIFNLSKPEQDSAYDHDEAPGEMRLQE